MRQPGSCHWFQVLLEFCTRCLSRTSFAFIWPRQALLSHKGDALSSLTSGSVSRPYLSWRRKNSHGEDCVFKVLGRRRDVVRYKRFIWLDDHTHGVLGTKPVSALGTHLTQEFLLAPFRCFRHQPTRRVFPDEGVGKSVIGVCEQCLVFGRISQVARVCWDAGCIGLWLQPSSFATQPSPR